MLCGNLAIRPAAISAVQISIASFPREHSDRTLNGAGASRAGGAKDFSEFSTTKVLDEAPNSGTFAAGCSERIGRGSDIRARSARTPAGVSSRQTQGPRLLDAGMSSVRSDARNSRCAGKSGGNASTGRSEPPIPRRLHETHRPETCIPGRVALLGQTRAQRRSTFSKMVCAANRMAQQCELDDDEPTIGVQCDSPDEHAGIDLNGGHLRVRRSGCAKFTSKEG